MFTRISGSDVAEFYPFCISPHPHIKISAMPIAAIVDLAPMSDLLPILDIDDVSYTLVHEDQKVEERCSNILLFCLNPHQNMKT